MQTLGTSSFVRSKRTRKKRAREIQHVIALVMIANRLIFRESDKPPFETDPRVLSQEYPFRGLPDSLFQISCGEE